MPEEFKSENAVEVPGTVGFFKSQTVDRQLKNKIGYGKSNLVVAKTMVHTG